MRSTFHTNVSRCGLMLLVTGAWALCAKAEEAPRTYPNAGGRLVWDRVRFYPAPGFEKDMLGGKFTGSNVSATAGYEVLAEIQKVPPADQWTELSFDGQRPHRWIRYEAPPGSFGHICKLEFYAGQKRLGGPGFGSIGAKPGPRDWPRVFDGKDSKFKMFMDSDHPNGNYVGLDVGDVATPVRPSLTPAPGPQEGPVQVALKSPTPGAVIRYTLDGTTPTATTGQLYENPIQLDKFATIVAVSFKEGFAPSPPAVGTYLLGDAAKPALSTFHIGNSLTGSTGRFPLYAQTAGANHAYVSYLQPGIMTHKLWEVDVQTTKERWEQTLAGLTRVDHFTVQPRDPDLDREARHEILFFDLIREKFPDMQPWIYAEWTSRSRNRPWDLGQVPSPQMQVQPVATWEESASAMLLYIEDLQRKVLETYQGPKRPRIIPSVLAAGWIKSLVDERKIPGMGPQDFDPIMFFDGVHPGPIGSYLIDMTWYAAFYGQSPVGKVLPIHTDLTSAQAAALQQLAWDVVKNYPDCGVYEEGSAPVAAPQVSVGPGEFRALVRVKLTSETPGAWFRYTLDGSTPTRTHGYVYCGAVSVRPGTTLKAVAYKSGMADSPATQWSPVPESVVLERDIPFGQGGKFPLKLDLLRPIQESARPRPVVMFVHGGSWSFGDKELNLENVIPLAASGDYVCASINYRVVSQAPWPAQLYDCKAAVRWLKLNAEKYHIDPDKIGVWGMSAGGHLAAMLGMTGDERELEGDSGAPGPSSRVAAVIDSAGPTDLLTFAAEAAQVGTSFDAILARLLDGPLAERQELARQASPLTYVARAGKNCPPFLLVHGMRDNVVSVSQAETFYAALKQAGADVTLVKITNGGHGMGGQPVADRARAFFDKHLRGQAVEVSDEPIGPPLK